MSDIYTYTSALSVVERKLCSETEFREAESESSNYKCSKCFKSKAFFDESEGNFKCFEHISRLW